MKKNNVHCALAFNWHDSSVSFAEGNEVLLVLEAERYFKDKKKMCTPREIEQLTRYGLSCLGKTIDDVSHWALETLGNPFLSDSQKEPREPCWADVGFFGSRKKALIVNHHLSHAASFLFSPKDEALILTCDGGGDFGERVTAYEGRGASLKKLNLPSRDYITAKIYDLCSSHLYLKEKPTPDPWLRAPRAEGKMMALAAFGKPREDFISSLEEICEELGQATYLGGYNLLVSKFSSLLGGAYNLNEDVCDFAATVHDYFTRRRLRDISFLVDHFKNSNLVLSGGSNLNLALNSSVWENIDPTVFIPPCCDDTGQSLGAISVLISEVEGKRPNLALPYLGFSSGKRTALDYNQIDTIVEDLVSNKICLVHNGRAEIGPRALGNRSFIIRPDNYPLKKALSEQIKRREYYRPVAPITLEDKAPEYFKGPGRSPFMLFQYEQNNESLSLIPSAFHKDKSARVQTLREQENPFMYQLIKRFGERTGIYVLLNTSLNLRGEPLSNSIGDTLDISKRINVPHTVIYEGEIIK